MRKLRKSAAIELLNSFLADDSGYDKEVYPLLHKRLEENESVSPNYEELEAHLAFAEYELEKLKEATRWFYSYVGTPEPPLHEVIEFDENESNRSHAERILRALEK